MASTYSMGTKDTFTMDAGSSVSGVLEMKAKYR